MGMLTYLPPMLQEIPQALPKGNLPIVEKGFIVSDPHYENGFGILVDGIIYLGKKALKFIATNGADFDQVFAIVAICGVFFIMAGFKKLGTKLTSGSIVGYTICKVVSETCK